MLRLRGLMTCKVGVNMRNTIVVSAFPACGKSYKVKVYNNKPYSMLDSDSSKFSWIKDENGNNTKVRNLEFPNNYIEYIKSNIGKVDVIFVSSHKEVRQALRDNDIKYFIVYPTVDMKEEFLKRMKDRGNTEEFIKMFENKFEEFVKEIEKECKEVDEKGSYINGFYYSPCCEERLTKDKPYLSMDFIDRCLDNTMDNLNCLWWN